MTRLLSLLCSHIVNVFLLEETKNLVDPDINFRGSPEKVSVLAQASGQWSWRLGSRWVRTTKTFWQISPVQWRILSNSVKYSGYSAPLCIFYDRRFGFGYEGMAANS